MTLKIRNRAILIFLGIFIATFITQILIFLYSILSGLLSFTALYDVTKKGFILVTNQNLFILTGILFQYLLVITDTYVLYRSFVKTQATEVPFFELFLFSIFLNTFRLWIPCFNLENTFSSMFMFCGNITLFSNILGPISLILMAVIPFTEQKQNYDKMTFSVLLISLFLSTLIPLNTTKTLSNYSVEHSFHKLIIAYTVIAYALVLIIYFFVNKNRGYKQKTTVGLAFLMAGTHLLEYCRNPLIMVMAVSFISAGSVLFLKNLHNQYLWID